jgi:hypothetical protein
LVWIINNVYLRGDVPLWNGSEVSLYSAQPSWGSSSKGIIHLPLVPWPGAPSVTLAAYYIERSGNASGPDGGDAIGLSGLTRQYSGFWMNIEGNGFLGQVGPFEWDKHYRPKFSQPGTIGVASGNGTWCITTAIESVEPSWERLPWTWMRFEFSPMFGRNYLFVQSAPTLLDSNSTDGVYYREVGTQDGMITPGDYILIVTHQAYWGGEDVWLNIGSSRIGHFRLPDYYP